MTRDFEIERLEGRGITAKVICPGNLYTTFQSFADAAGYPKAYRPSDTDIKGKAVKVLAKGKHDMEDSVLYVIEDDRGAHYVIGGQGLDIEIPQEISCPTVTEIIDAYERGYAKGKAEAIAEMRRVIGE